MLHQLHCKGLIFLLLYFVAPALSNHPCWASKLATFAEWTYVELLTEPAKQWNHLNLKIFPPVTVLSSFLVLFCIIFLVLCTSCLCPSPSTVIICPALISYTCSSLTCPSLCVKVSVLASVSLLCCCSVSVLMRSPCPCLFPDLLHSFAWVLLDSISVYVFCFWPSGLWRFELW